VTRSAAGRACRAAEVVLPALALVLAAGLYFRDLLPLPEPSRYIGGDFASYFYPVFRYVAEEVGAGRLPHWTPYLGAGYPLLADIEASVLYPPIRLLTVFTGPPSYIGLEIYAIGHYVLAGLGMLALGRQIGLSVLAASVSAVAFMLSGFEWAHSAHLSIIQATAWLPWLLAAHARALATRSARWIGAAASLFALLVLGGHPQIAFYAAVALALHAAVTVRGGWRGARWPARLHPVGITLAVLLLGLGLAGPQLLPTAALASTTSRWHPSPGFLVTDTLPLDQLLTFLIPLAYFGTARYRSVDELYAYVGIGALVLASAAVVLRRDAWSRYFGLLLMTGLVLALVPLVPGFAALAPRVPVLGLFRASARAVLLTDFGAAALAGMGLDAWSRALVKGEAGTVRRLVWGWRVCVALALAGGALVGLGRIPAWLGPVAPQFAEFYGGFLVALVAHVVVLELWRARWLRPPLAALATVGLILLNLTSPHRAHAWTMSPPERGWQTTEVAAFLRAEPERQRVWNQGWIHRRGPVFEANAGLVDRLEIVSHYTSLQTRRFDEFSREIGTFWRNAALLDLLGVSHVVLAEEDTSLHHRGRYSPPRLESGEERRYDLRSLLGGSVGDVLVSLETDPGIPWARAPGLVLTGGPTLDVCLGCPPSGGRPARTWADGRTMAASAALPRPVPATRIRLRNALPHAVTVRELWLDEVDLYALGSRYRQLGPGLWANRAPLPRAFLVEDVLVLPDRPLVVPTLRSVEPRHTAIVETTPACQARLRPSASPPPDSAVEILEHTPHFVRLRTHHARPAVLVLTDAHYKEWRARVDGERTGIVPVDLLFRGLCVPAGEHVVEFRYKPLAFRQGLAFALLAGLGVLAGVGVERWRQR
jgi:hypothetical protein